MRRRSGGGTASAYADRYKLLALRPGLKACPPGLENEPAPYASA